jgi:uncharacterized membrane protein
VTARLRSGAALLILLALCFTVRAAATAPAGGGPPATTESAVTQPASSEPAVTSSADDAEVSKLRRLVDWLHDHGLPPELVVVIVATLPIFELRGAVPVGLLIFDMHWAEVYVLSVIGNMIPIIPIVLLIGPVSDFLMKRSRFWHRFFTWMFERSKRRGADLVEKYEAFGLGLFVAIPLPVTGAWTGSMLAFLMHVRARRAFPCILGGVLTAGGVVTLVSLFARETFSFLIKM